MDTCTWQIYWNWEKFLPFLHQFTLEFTNMSEYIFIQPYDQSVSFIQWNKISRHYHGTIRINPTHQWFCSYDFFYFHIIFWLEICHKFFIADRRFKPILQSTVLHLLLIHLFCIVSNAVFIIIADTSDRHKASVTDYGNWKRCINIFINTIFDHQIRDRSILCNFLCQLLHCFQR